jgi:hypothetical protein
VQLSSASCMCVRIACAIRVWFVKRSLEGVGLVGEPALTSDRPARILTADRLRSITNQQIFHPALRGRKLSVGREWCINGTV